MSFLKFILKFLAFSVVNLYVKKPSNLNKDKLLLIRLDAIGDYVLFRNFIKSIKESESYKQYEIILVGNVAWKSLAEYLDDEYIDRFIWIDRQKFNRSLVYRHHKLKEICSEGYEICLSPVYSRDFFYSDWIVKTVLAKNKVGSVGNCSNIKSWQKRWSDKYYTNLIGSSSKLMFEFERNNEFFSSLINKNVLPNRLKIDLPYVNYNFEMNLPNDPYAVIFIGGSTKFKKWSIDNFIFVAEHISKKFGLEIVICGAPHDLTESNYFVNNCSFPIVNLVNKTSLVDLLYVLNDCCLLVSNETCAPHLAVALNVKNIFIIFNGNHYGRFLPYPLEMSKTYHVIYHPKIEEDLAYYQKLSNSYEFSNNLDINDIIPEMVIRKIDTNIKLGEIEKS